jgi:trans-aconitate 2-methyltransferase
MREMAANGRWEDNPAMRSAVRDQMPSIDSYYDVLKPLCTHVHIWHTIYNHTGRP